MRVDHAVAAPIIVKREDFEKDYQYGFVVLEHTPEHDIEFRDRRTGKVIKRHVLSVLVYRCVDCQFDSLDRELVEKHRAEGEHPWPYDPFSNPYGKDADIQIEGIEDYAVYLAAKGK